MENWMTSPSGPSPMGRPHGRPAVRENIRERERHLTRYPTTSTTSIAKEMNLTGGPSSMPPSSSPWVSNFGLQMTSTTTTTSQPRPVFSPQTSYSYKPSSTSIERQPSNYEFYLPRSNSDLLVGAMNQRDQYAMETHLNTPFDGPVPPPPPLLSGGRLAAIIIL